MHNLSFVETNTFLVKFVLATFLFIQFPIRSIAQEYTPNEINYQGVARGANGKEICNKSITVTFSILENSVNGNLVYEEKHNVTTNSYGLFSLAIGTGEITGGTVSNLGSIGWGNSAHYLRVKLIIDGGSEISGTTQMFSVPYALYAVKSGDAGLNFEKVAFDVQTSKITNNGAPVLDLSSLMQSLSFDQSNAHLTISGSSDFADLSALKQDLRINYNTDELHITDKNDYTIVNLKPYKQTLALTTDGKISISNGNSVSIDTSSMNEIQDLARNGNKITLSRNGGEVTIDDADADSNNELITSIDFNQNSRLLSIHEGASNVKSINISAKKVAFRAIKTSNYNMVSGANTTMIFADERLDLSNNYNASTGVFTVPVNGSGTYCFFFTYEASDATLKFELLINDQNPELLLTYNQPVIFDLQENDTIKIRVTASDDATVKKASFIGYKIQ